MEETIDVVTPTSLDKDDGKANSVAKPTANSLDNVEMELAEVTTPLCPACPSMPPESTDELLAESTTIDKDANKANSTQPPSTTDFDDEAMKFEGPVADVEVAVAEVEAAIQEIVKAEEMQTAAAKIVEETVAATEVAKEVAKVAKTEADALQVAAESDPDLAPEASKAAEAVEIAEIAVQEAEEKKVVAEVEKEKMDAVVETAKRTEEVKEVALEKVLEEKTKAVVTTTATAAKEAALEMSENLMKSWGDACVGFVDVEGVKLPAVCSRMPDDRCPATFDPDRCTVLQPVLTDLVKGATLTTL